MSAPVGMAETREGAALPAFVPLLSPVEVSMVAEDAPIRAVTVYGDRAEVSRSLQLTPSATGPHDIVVKGLSKHVDADSFRVSGRGAFEILEVAYKASPIVQESREQERAELNAELQEIRKEKGKHLKAIERIQNQRTVLHAYVNSMIKDVRFDASPDDTENSKMKRLLEFYGNQMELLDKSEFQTQELSDLLEKRATEISTRLSTYGVGAGNRNQISHDVTISINVQSLGEVLDLHLQYVVSGNTASWDASYDIRISSEDDSMTLVYCALVRQSTGEDWKGCSLALSPAAPHRSGQPEPLPRRCVQFHVPQAETYYRETERSHMMSNAAFGANVRQAEMGAVGGRNLSLESKSNILQDAPAGPPCSAPPIPQAATVLQTSVASNVLGNTIFHIPRQTVVESNNKSHKVTIATLTFAPRMLYYIGPSVSPHAYVHAHTRNTSEYLLLPSTRASVFIDGSFVTHTHMPMANPSEMFHTFLGVDPSVRVDYSPMKQSTRLAGWVARTHVRSVEHCTTITNTKPVPIRVTLAEVLPRSTDERIKVELVRPCESELSTPSQDRSQGVESDFEALAEGSSADTKTGRAMQNPTTNNLVWTLAIDPGEKTSIPLKYTITWPEGKSITVS